VNVAVHAGELLGGLDHDGGEATETVRVGLDGVSYEIDLNDGNAAKLRDALAQYVKNALRTSGTTRSRGQASAPGYDPKAVRAWAASNRVELPARGRIPALVLEQYRAAGN
jgi:hypothetical protein